jgi:dolichol-phosphate mannosyltransferase
MISVVVPMYNEGDGIQKFLDGQLLPVVKNLKQNVELVLVDDGSQDKTLEKIKKCKLIKVVESNVISFSRNFGKEAALSAGLQNARGDAVIMIDADGQHPAEIIPKMIKEWEAGADVVTAVRTSNTTKHKIGSKLYYGAMKLLGGGKVVPGAMDFRLLDRRVVDEFNKFTEHNRMVRGLVDWLGFNQAYIKVNTKDRVYGKPTYSFKKLMQLAGDSMASTSRTPLVIFGYIGLFIMITSFIFGTFILVQQYILGDPMGLDWSGAVAMSVFVSFLVGLVLVSQAMTALYISQIHMEAKDRPLFVVDAKKSFRRKVKNEK